MNSNLQPPIPSDIESRITALLLGELGADEARSVETQIRASAEWSLLYERLRQTVGLLREAAKPTPSMSPAIEPAPRLASSRRDVLMTLFKTVPMTAPAIAPTRKQPPQIRWPMMVFAVAACFTVGFFLILPYFVKARVRVAAGSARTDSGSAPRWFFKAQEPPAASAPSSESVPNGTVLSASVEDGATAQGARDWGRRADAAAGGFGGVANGVVTAPSPPVTLQVAPPPADEMKDRVYLPQTASSEPSRFARAPSEPEALGLSDPLSSSLNAPAAVEATAASGGLPRMMTRYGLRPAPASRPSVALFDGNDFGSTTRAKRGETSQAAGHASSFGDDTIALPAASLAYTPAAPASAPESPVAGARLEGVEYFGLTAPGASRPAKPAPSQVMAFRGLDTATLGDALSRSSDAKILAQGVEGERGAVSAYGRTEMRKKQEGGADKRDINTLQDLSEAVNDAEIVAGKPVSASAVRAYGTTEAKAKAVDDLKLADLSTPDAAASSSARFGDVSRENLPKLTAANDLAASPAAPPPARAERLNANADRSRRLSALAERNVGEKVAAARKEQVLGRAFAESVPAQPLPVPQAEVSTATNAFSTFSLNVTDVSFKLAAASLAAGNLPSADAVRVEEFVNAFDYRDPLPSPGSPVGFVWERARYPFAHNRDVLRFSVKTAAQGREPGRPLNVVVLLDNSGSMERADRVAIIREAMRVLAGQLRPQDRVSVVAFARTARLWVDGLSGGQGAALVNRVAALIPEGGTNLEEALNTGYATALTHFQPKGVNRVILLTDGAANLGDVDPDSLQRTVEAHRAKGIALDCFGIGWEGLNDALLEQLARHGDGRYGFVNTPEEASTHFVNQLAGALRVAAADVKVQVEFNPDRVTNWKQIGYAKHQLKKEQFRDNTVDAAELAASEAGNALYLVQPEPQGSGPIATVRVRYREPETGEYRELSWSVPYNGTAPALADSSPSLRLASSAGSFGEWLAGGGRAGDITLGNLTAHLRGVSGVFSPDPRPAQFETMLGQARSITGQ